MDMLFNSNRMEMPGDKVLMPVDYIRSSGLINRRLLDFIQEKSSKPWVANCALGGRPTPQSYRGAQFHGQKLLRELWRHTILQMHSVGLL